MLGLSATATAPKGKIMSIPTTATAVTRPRKPWYLRWWALTLYILIVVTLLGSVVSTVAGSPKAAAEREALAEQQAEREASRADEDPATVVPEPTPEPGERSDVSPSGLHASTAQAACDMAAEDEFIFGVRMHWWTGLLAEKVDNETGGWWLKVEATPRNAYGTEIHGVNIECHVSGPDNAPVVTELLAYGGGL